ncbi:uncharacterized protein LOC141651449 [Silene latifolia]|uniref:uncharacterized protein LOC141651449 n=1 Tax=Silene latifolia TaxID=37657 RepID=UPI003D76CA50
MARNLKMLKPFLRSLNRSLFYDIERNADVAFNLLIDCQLQLQKDPTNVILMDKEKTAFLEYYETLLGSSAPTSAFYKSIVTQGATPDESEWPGLCSLPTEEEIRKVIFSIPNDKSPGQDGYTSCFYKASWETIHGDLCAAIKDFLFMMFNEGGLRKAYDSIEWDFVASMLDALHFPQFIKLVMQCVSTTSYSIGLNGQNYGFFHGKRGLRQEEPISPLLFTLCMEYISRLLTMGSGLPGFKFHPLCKSLRLNHLMFADDLLLFCKDEVKSICIIMELFKRFSTASGLCINNEKSDFYSNGMQPAMVHQIFVLPIGVMDRIQALCWNFLWEGSDKYSKAPLVSWNVLCNSKKHGGLGLIDSKQWNIAGTDWMLYEPTSSSSWAWRKICDVKNVYKLGYAQGNWCGDDRYIIAAGYDWLRQEHLLKQQ